MFLSISPYHFIFKILKNRIQSVFNIVFIILHRNPQYLKTTRPAKNKKKISSVKYGPYAKNMLDFPTLPFLRGK